MKTAAEFEQWIESIVNRRLAQLLGVEPEEIEAADEAELRARVAERAAKMRAARGAR